MVRLKMPSHTAWKKLKPFLNAGIFFGFVYNPFLKTFSVTTDYEGGMIVSGKPGQSIGELLIKACEAMDNDSKANTSNQD